MINAKYLKKKSLPDEPGVYLFKYNKTVLYVGKATSLKDRVRSYFNSDLLSTRGPLLVDLLSKANKIDFIKTDSVLEAIILEVNLIKKYQPKYNTKEKDNKSFNYVIITKEDFPRVLISRGREIKNGLPYEIQRQFGPYTNSTQLKVALKIIRRIFPFRDLCKINQNKPCFNYQIGLCPGTCVSQISKFDYIKNVKNIELFLSGKKKQIISRLNQEMNGLAKSGEYEKAGMIRNKIFSLNHIQDIALINEEHNHPSLPEGENGAEGPRTRGLGVEKEDDGAVGKFRIEAYDIAHLSGENNVGAMVVMENGEFKKSNYRKFKINNSRGNDIKALAEVLERRLKHTEWPLPDLIVMDGGLAQLNAARKATAHEHNRPVHQNGHPFLQKQYTSHILSTKRSRSFIWVPTQISTLTKAGINGRLAATFVVAVTKNDRHKPKAIIGDEKIVKKYKKQILQINNEVHRFTIKYHRSKRRII